MSLFKFQNNQFTWCVFDTEEEEDVEDFEIEEIRFCDCFLDQILFFIQKNNNVLTFKNFYINFYYEIPNKYKSLDVYVYYTPVTIICCKNALYHPLYEQDADKYKMDDDCLAEQIDYCCLHYLNREPIFNFICDNCQRNLLRLVSEKRFIIFKLKK